MLVLRKNIIFSFFPSLNLSSLVNRILSDFLLKSEHITQYHEPEPHSISNKFHLGRS